MSPTDWVKCNVCNEACRTPYCLSQHKCYGFRCPNKNCGKLVHKSGKLNTIAACKEAHKCGFQTCSICKAQWIPNGERHHCGITIPGNDILGQFPRLTFLRIEHFMASTDNCSFCTMHEFCSVHQREKTALCLEPVIATIYFEQQLRGVFSRKTLVHEKIQHLFTEYALDGLNELDLRQCLPQSVLEKDLPPERRRINFGKQRKTIRMDRIKKKTRQSLMDRVLLALSEDGLCNSVVLCLDGEEKEMVNRVCKLLSCCRFSIFFSFQGFLLKSMLNNGLIDKTTLTCDEKCTYGIRLPETDVRILDFKHFVSETTTHGLAEQFDLQAFLHWFPDKLRGFENANEDPIFPAMDDFDDTFDTEEIYLKKQEFLNNLILAWCFPEQMWQHTLSSLQILAQSACCFIANCFALQDELFDAGACVIPKEEFQYLHPMSGSSWTVSGWAFGLFKFLCLERNCVYRILRDQVPSFNTSRKEAKYVEYFVQEHHKDHNVRSTHHHPEGQLRQPGLIPDAACLDCNEAVFFQGIQLGKMIYI